MPQLYVATTSPTKLSHYQHFFCNTQVEIVPTPLALLEPQFIEPRDVANEKLRQALQQTEVRPLLVDDVGLSIEGLVGFPGAFLKPLLERGGMRLLRDLSYSQIAEGAVAAEFVCALALHDGNQSYHIEGRMMGQIQFRQPDHLDDRSTGRCFIPQGESQSIYQLESVDLSRAYAHRFQALRMLLEHCNALSV